MTKRIPIQMKKNLLLILALALTCSISMYSQDTVSRFRVFGIVGGMNSTIKNQYKPISTLGVIGDQESSKNKLNIGIGLEYSLSKYFSIQTGIGFSFQGSKATTIITDTTYINWKSEPVRYETQTDYTFLSIPLALKFNALHMGKLVLSLKSGVQLNSIINYKCITTEVYFDKTTLDYNASSEKNYFNKTYYSLINSLSLEYALSAKMYLGTEFFYNYSLNGITGREIVAGSPYKIRVTDMGLRLMVGYKL